MVATVCLAEQLQPDPQTPVAHGSVPHFKLFFRPSLIILECVFIFVWAFVCVYLFLHVLIPASCLYISSVDLKYLISKPAPAMLLLICTFQPVVEGWKMRTCRQRRGIACWLSTCPYHSRRTLFQEYLDRKFFKRNSLNLAQIFTWNKGWTD